MEGAGEAEQAAPAAAQKDPLAPMTPASQPLSSGDDAWQQTANAVAPLAKEAASLYQSKSYQECLTLLQQLLAKKENDPKVLHNIALTEFHRDGCTDPYKLLDVLEKVKRRCEELARAADEQLEGIGNSVNSPSGSTTGTSSKPAASDGVGYIEDYDTSIPSLNTAIVFYHLKQYASAIAVLEPLFANIEPVDETSALQICLLMLDITLASRQPEKAAAVLQYMEKSYGLAHGSEAIGTVQQVAPQISIQPSVSSTLEGRNLSVGISSAAMPSPFVSSPSGESALTHSGEETFEEDALSIGLELDGSQSVRNTVLPARLSPVEKPPPASAADLKLLMHLYKVRFLLLMHNWKAAKREVKSALNLSRDNLTALLLKAQLEYSRGNYRKAMKLLTTCSNRGEPAIAPMILSNLGCVYHQLRKDQSAAMFFVKALQTYSSMSKERPLKLSTFSQDKSLSIYYNCGMIQLLGANPILAARCFQESAPLYYNKPLLWLRLAECCISALEKGLLTDVSPKKEEVKVVVVGQGKWRRLVLPSGSMNPTLTGSVKESDELPFGYTQGGKSGKPFVLSMAFARQCLQNALHLLDRIDAKAEEDHSSSGSEVKAGEDESQVLATSDAVPYRESGGGTLGAALAGNGEGKNGGSIVAALTSHEAETKKEKIMERLCVLVDLAFVELCLENPLPALKSAEAVLQHPQCTKAYSFLGHVYAAEALCLLNRSKEAQERLATCMMDWTSTSADYVEEDGQKWRSGENSEASGDGEDASFVGNKNLTEQMNFLKYTGAQARGSLYVNFAAIHAVEGELVQARQCALQALAIVPGNTLAVLAMVYVELAQGRSKEAVAMLKRCRHLSVSKLKPQPESVFANQLL